MLALAEAAEAELGRVELKSGRAETFFLEVLDSCLDSCPRRLLLRVVKGWRLRFLALSERIVLAAPYLSLC